MEAVVLAGGLGTRLRERVPGVPKALAPVAGRPFLAWLLDQLVDAGFRRVILSVGHLGDEIRRVCGEAHGPLELIYAVEASPLGTGGALQNTLAITGRSDEPIWVLNGDSILNLDHAQMWRAHRTHGVDPFAMTMAVTAVPDAIRYGVLEIRQGRVTRFSPAGAEKAGAINAGVYLLHRDVFKAWHLPAVFSFETDFLARFADRLRIAAFETDGWFIDIGVPADYERAQIELPTALSRVPASADEKSRKPSPRAGT